MRLVQITDHWFPDKIGGSCRYAFELAHLLGTEAQVTTITLQGAAWPEEAGLRVEKTLKKLGFAQNHRHLVAALRRLRPDALVLHSPLAWLHVRRAARHLSIPVIAVFHGPWGKEAAHKYGNARGLRARLLARFTFLLAHADRAYLKRVDRVIVLSDYMRRQAEALCAVGDRARIIPFWSPRPIPARPEAVQAPPYRLVALRRLEHRMGLQDLLGAMSRAPAGTELEIIGTGTYERALRDHARQLGIAERVHFVGHVSEAEKQARLRKADFMVLPSADLEGFGIVVLEALEQGVPVICREGVGFLDFHLPEMAGAIFRYRSEEELVGLLSAPARVAITPAAFAQFSPAAVAGRFREAITGVHA